MFPKINVQKYDYLNNHESDFLLNYTNKQYTSLNNQNLLEK